MLVMKAYIFLCVILVGCGGNDYQKQDWEIDRELCEAQDGEAQLLQVFNIDTGEQYLETKCVFQKQPSYGMCKPDNGLGHECPQI
jgi:hypothetical protein